MKGLEVFLYKALGLLYEMHPLLTPFPYQGTSNVGNALVSVRNASFAYAVPLSRDLKCAISRFEFRLAVWTSIALRQ